MINRTFRAAFFGSSAALIVAIVPLRNGAIHELKVLKRVAEERTALFDASKLSTALLPRGFGAVPRRSGPAAPAPAPEAASPPAAQPELDVLALEVPAPGLSAPPTQGEPPAATQGEPPAPTQGAQGGPAKESIPVSPAALAWRKGDVAALRTLAKAAIDPDERLGLEWAALRADPHPLDVELADFALAHPTWPGNAYIRFRQEADLLSGQVSPSAVLAHFAADPPQSVAGKLAMARAAGAAGRANDAIRTVRDLWREDNFDSWTETLILREFGAVLVKADHKYRADRLLYAENYGPAMRAAALAGPDEVALAQARMAAARGPLSAALIKAVPLALQKDPGLLFARIQDARRSNRAYEAATLISLAPADHAALINPDKWWSERRMVARELLDINEPKLAYQLCEKAAKPDDAAARVDLDFHAGWIALRFLGDAPEAAKRFALAAEAAETPLSIARAAYWRGRAAEAMGDADEAKLLYASAASEPIAYYGQLAAEHLGAKHIILREPVAVKEGAERDNAVRAAEALYRDGLDDLATGLAYDAARTWRDEAQMAAMAAVVKRYGEASTQVQFGKIATQRGYAFDAMAFPSTGVPAFLPLAHSADLASVYAVARQESEFLWRAASGAGAKGLMQILPSTAASTARRAGVIYDPVRLIADPAFNTQLGAAFLGQVMEDVGGSPELAFAAYNAGPGRVAQWIAAYGDPRKGTTADLVDWIERIPYDETRDYVERVAENLRVYRQRLTDEPPPPAQISAFAAKE
jgi:soluble lytic murein transglycosylase